MWIPTLTERDLKTSDKRGMNKTTVLMNFY